MTCVYELVNQYLESFFCMYGQDGIVCEEGLFDGDGHDLGLGSESGQVEQFAVRSCVQVDSVFVVVEGAGLGHGQEDPEGGGGEHTALPGSALDGEWLRCCTVVADCAVRVRMEGLHHGVQFRGAADLLQELKQSASTDKVKRLGEIYEGKEERLALFLAFLLQLSITSQMYPKGKNLPSLVANELRHGSALEPST